MREMLAAIEVELRLGKRLYFATFVIASATLAVSLAFPYFFGGGVLQGACFAPLVAGAVILITRGSRNLRQQATLASMPIERTIAYIGITVAELIVFALMGFMLCFAIATPLSKVSLTPVKSLLEELPKALLIFLGYLMLCQGASFAFRNRETGFAAVAIDIGLSGIYGESIPPVKFLFVTTALSETYLAQILPHLMVALCLYFAGLVTFRRADF